MKTTLTATMPDGTIATRTSERAYTHLIVGRYPKGWAPACWTMNADQAMAREQAKMAKKYYGFSSGPYKHISLAVALELVVVPVNTEVG